MSNLVHGDTESVTYFRQSTITSLDMGWMNSSPSSSVCVAAAAVFCSAYPQVPVRGSEQRLEHSLLSFHKSKEIIRGIPFCRYHYLLYVAKRSF